MLNVPVFHRQKFRLRSDAPVESSACRLCPTRATIATGQILPSSMVSNQWPGCQQILQPARDPDPGHGTLVDPGSIRRTWQWSRIPAMWTEFGEPQLIEAGACRRAFDGMRVEESAAKVVAESAAAGAFTRSRWVVVSADGGRWWRRRVKSDGPIPVVLVRPVPVLSIGPCGDAAEDTQHQEQESHQPALPSSIHPRRPCRGSANGRVIVTSVPVR